MPKRRNDSRYDRAHRVVMFYSIEHFNLADVLADLIHWCDQEGHDFDANLAKARERLDREDVG